MYLLPETSGRPPSPHTSARSAVSPHDGQSSHKRRVLRRTASAGCSKPAELETHRSVIGRARHRRERLCQRSSLEDAIEQSEMQILGAVVVVDAHQSDQVAVAAQGVQRALPRELGVTAVEHHLQVGMADRPQERDRIADIVERARENARDTGRSPARRRGWPGARALWRSAPARPVTDRRRGSGTRYPPPVGRRHRGRPPRPFWPHAEPRH